jgi:peroxiredoxin
MLFLAGLIPWMIVALCCWVGYNLVRQNGRILLRLQAIEQQLNQLRLGIAPPPHPTPAAAVPKGLPVGSIAPSFELADLRGHQKKLSQWSGQRILLLFFNPQCGFCVRLAPEIAALGGKTLMPLLMPLVVSTGDMAENQKLVAEHRIQCPVLLQKQMEVAAQYQVSGTPIGYLVDEQGRIASEMAVGADALLALAREANGAGASTTAEHGNGAGHVAHKGNRDMSSSSIKRDGLAKGTKAPAFRLPLLDGGELELADYRGRPVLLVFSDPGCGPCQELAPRLNQHYSQNREIEVIMISRGDREANRRKAAEHGLRFPITLQKQWEISRLYGMFATPIGYLIDERGIIAADVATGAEPILALLSNHAASSKTMAATG